MSVLQVLYLVALYTVNSQYTTIWYDNMESNNGWDLSNPDDIVFPSASGIYPIPDDICPEAPCAQLRTYTTSSTTGTIQTWISKSTDIPGYTSVRLGYDVFNFALQSGDECRVYYAYDSIDNKQFLKAYTGDDDVTRYPDEVIDLPSSPSSTTVWIFLEIVGTLTDYCYYDNVFLEGIPDSTITSSPSQSTTNDETTTYALQSTQYFGSTSKPLTTRSTTYSSISQYKTSNDIMSTTKDETTTYSSSDATQYSTSTSKSETKRSTLYPPQYKTSIASIPTTGDETTAYSKSNSRTTSIASSTDISSKSTSSSTPSTIYIIISAVVFVVVIVCVFAWIYYGRYRSMEKRLKEMNDIDAKMDDDNDRKVDDRVILGERSNEMVRVWLTATVGLPQYYPLFIANGLDCLDFISNIANKEDLKDIGISVIGHQIQILAEIELLRKGEALSDKRKEHDDGSESQQKEGVVEVEHTTDCATKNAPETITGGFFEA